MAPVVAGLAQSDAIEDHSFAGTALRVAFRPEGPSEGRSEGKTESVFEVNRQPLRVDRNEPPGPASQIGPQVLDFTLPDLRYGGREVLRVSGGHPVENPIGNAHRLGHVLLGDGQQAGALQLTE